jgi:hypothetical protein
MLKIRIPKKLRTPGGTYKIKKSSTLEKRQGLLGMCVEVNKYISIDCNQSKIEMEKTFVHEALHSVFPNNMCSDKLEEEIVRALEEGLHYILTHNKLIVHKKRKRK